MPPSALIEKYMPRFDVRERHEAVVEAEPSRTYAALRALDVNRSLLVRIIFAIRTLPARLSSALPPPKGRSRAITETRVHATDPVSRRRFRRYWILFGVGIKLIRVLALRLLRKDLRAGREV